MDGVVKFLGNINFLIGASKENASKLFESCNIKILLFYVKRLIENGQKFLKKSVLIKTKLY